MSQIGELIQNPTCGDCGSVITRRDKRCGNCQVAVSAGGVEMLPDLPAPEPDPDEGRGRE